MSYFSAHTRPPQRLNRAPKAGLAKSRGRHGSFPHYAHRRPNFTGDRSEARGHGTAHAALPPGSLHAGCACWCAPDGFAAQASRGHAGCCNAGRRARPRPSAGVGLADGVIEAAKGLRARAPRAHRCTGRSRTTPSAHSATFFGSCKMPNSSILPRGKASAGAKAAATRAAPLVLPSPPPQSTRRGSARNLERAWDGTLADRLTRTSTLAPPRRTVR